jgi:hypothetical protein
MPSGSKVKRATAVFGAKLARFCNCGDSIVGKQENR